MEALNEQLAKWEKHFQNEVKIKKKIFLFLQLYSLMK